jgi:hypothetical protein
MMPVEAAASAARAVVFSWTWAAMPVGFPSKPVCIWEDR